MARRDNSKHRKAKRGCMAKAAIEWLAGEK
jgi:hypothetical protein